MTDIDRELAEAMGWIEHSSGVYVYREAGKEDSWPGVAWAAWCESPLWRPSTSLDQMHGIVEPEINRRELRRQYGHALLERGDLLRLIAGGPGSPETMIVLIWRVANLSADIKARAALEVLRGKEAMTRPPLPRPLRDGKEIEDEHGRRSP